MPRKREEQETHAASRNEGQSNSRKSRRVKSKRILSKRFIVALSIVVLVVALGIGYLVTKSDRVIQLLNVQRYEDIVRSKGFLAFQEISPKFLIGTKLDLQDVDKDARVSKDTKIAPLDAATETSARSELQELQRQLASVTSDTERSRIQRNIDYLDQVIQSKQVFAPRASFVASGLDGYESILTPENVLEMRPGDIDFTDSSGSTMDGVKFVDNRMFYLVTEVAQQVVAMEWKIGSFYKVEIAETEVSAKLISVQQDDTNAQMLVFEVSEDYEQLRNKRSVDVTILRQELDAFTIPLTSAFEENNKVYCYILNADDIAVKTQVHLVGVTDEGMSLVVRALNETERANEKDRQLRRFDQVVVKPEGVVEGVMYR